MGLDPKIFLGLGTAAVTVALAAKKVIKKSEEKKALKREKRTEEVLKELASMPPPYSYLNNGVCNEICINKKEIVDTVKDFFSKISIGKFDFQVYHNEEALLEYDPSIDTSNILADSLSNYKDGIIRLHKCFQDNAEMLIEEFSDKKISVSEWENWSSHTKFLFRDIVILADFIYDVCAPFNYDQLNPEYINSLNSKINNILEQYQAVIQSPDFSSESEKLVHIKAIHSIVQDNRHKI